MLRILLVSYWCLPHIGGVNTYVHCLKKACEKQGHHVDILAYHPNMQKVYLMNDDCHFENAECHTNMAVDISAIRDIVCRKLHTFFEKHLPYVNQWICWGEIQRYTFELAASMFDLNKYDIIHAQDSVSARALWRVKPNHIPLVSTLHTLMTTVHMLAGDITDKGSLSFKYAVAEEFYGAVSSDTTIVPTRWLQQELMKLGVPDDKFTIIPYGMDIESFVEHMQDDPNPPVERTSVPYVIACPARLVPIKNHKTLLDALCMIKQRRHHFTCWIIGDGPLRKHLESYCKENHIADRVVFMGNRTDVPALLNKADIIVLPSLEDNHPYVIMEAQIAGKAIVASKAGGIPHLIKHRETGLLFETQNHCQLAEHLTQVMENHDLRYSLQTKARTWGEHHWSSKLLYERTMNVYLRVLEKATMPTRNPKKYHDRRNSERLQTESVVNNFSFHVDKKINTNSGWHAFPVNLPPSYSIPDTALIQCITDSF